MGKGPEDLHSESCAIARARKKQPKTLVLQSTSTAVLVGCLKKSGTFQRVHWTHCTGACCQLSTGPHVHAGVSGADNDAHTQLAATTRCHRMSLPAASLRPRNRAEGSQETYGENELSARVEWHVSTCSGGRSWPAATSRRHGAWSAWHAWRAQAAASMG